MAMTTLTRRGFAGLLGGAAALPLLGAHASAARAPRVVVIGGGFAGATFAKYLRRAMPDVRITLVEPKSSYISCVYSNEVVVGLSSLKPLTVTYEALAEAYRIRHLKRRAVEIDTVGRRVRLASGQSLPYDKLIVAPGMAYRYDAVPGWTKATAADLPAAWHAGPETTLLAARLKEMAAGATAIITVPPAPYRCPPAPYERASLFAWFLKRNNPSAKVLILDANETFPKQALFEEGWDRLFPGMVTRIPASEGGAVQSVDAAAMRVVAAAGTFEAGLINVIPPQKAGALADATGLTDGTGWCPVDPRTFASTLIDDVHVLGDAAASGLPKSATSANAGAKVAALAVAESFAGRPATDPLFINTCYSRLAPDYAIGIASVFGVDADGKIVVRNTGTGTSPLGASLGYRKEEAEDADKWFRALMADTFA
jgi:sulfide dehydrogenase [flavocytochrome c] flavoprotein subunit